MIKYASIVSLWTILIQTSTQFSIGWMHIPMDLMLNLLDREELLISGDWKYTTEKP